MTLTEMLAALRRDRAQLERTLVALLVIGVSAYLGIIARRRAAPIKAQLVELTSASQKVSAFSSAFRPLSPADENRLLVAADTATIAVSPASRLLVGQEIVTDAEQIGLRDVRLRFSPADSAYIPPRGTGAAAPKAADYLVIVEGRGVYTQLLDLIDRLPAGVAVIRVGAAATNTDTRYRVTLAVYETANANQRG